MRATFQGILSLLILAPAAFACQQPVFTISVFPTSNLGSVAPGTAINGITVQARTTGYNGTSDGASGTVAIGATSQDPSTLALVPNSFTVSPATIPWGTAGFAFTMTFGLIPEKTGSQSTNILLTPTCVPYIGQPVYVLFSYNGTGAAAGPPIVTANAPNSGGAAEPVSTATGELYGCDESPDLALGGPLPVNFQRYCGSYLSGNGISSALGANWMHNFDVKLLVSGAAATVTLFRGKTVRFTQSGSAWTLSSTEQRPYQMAAASGGYLFLDPRSNLIYAFNSNGALTSIQDRNGNALTVTPGSSGPTQVSDGLGRTLTLTYTGANLTKIQDQSGRTVSFEYSNGTLAAWTDANGNRSTFSYGSAGSLSALLTSQTRPAGNVPFSQQYDSQGRVALQSDRGGTAVSFDYTSANGATLSEPEGVALTHTHDANLNLTSVSDPSGAASKFGYDANNRLNSAVNRLGAQSAAVWDAASGLISSFTDELGNVTAYKYASSTAGGFSFYDLSTVSFANGTSVSLTHDSKGNITAFTDPAGKIWQFSYNSRGQVATATNPSGGIATYTYGPDATLTSLQLPSGDTTQLSYDSAKRLVTVKQPDGTTRAFQYDGLDHVLKLTDERGDATASSFDANGNLKTVTDALGAAATIGYDDDDRFVSFTDALGKMAQQTWDANSRVRSVTDPTGVSTTYSYDNLNRLTGETDAAGKLFAYGKDAEDRLISVTDPLARTTTLARDAHGQITSLTTPNAEKFSTAYDALGRIASETDALNRITQYTYDPRGPLSSVALPGGINGSLARNELGLITAMTDPNGNVWSSSFDNMGRQVSKTDPLGQATAFQYDSRQRVSAATLPQGSVQFSYDAASNLTGQTYSDGTALTYTYDADNRLTGGTGLTLTYDSAGRLASSNTLQIGRDAAGRLASITYAAGKIVKYTYDNRGLLTQVADWVAGATNFTYDGACQLTGIAFANGVSQSYTYDADGRIASITVGKGGTAISSIALQRDALGRVVSAQRPAATMPILAATSFPLAYDAASQSVAASYDAIGRVTGDSLRTYLWDLASRLTSYQSLLGSASFTYDALGQRISRTAGGATQTYVVNYALKFPSVSIVRSGASDQTYYIWLPDGTLLESVDAASSARRFYHFDETGSANYLTDDTGAVSDTYAITPYGDSVSHTGATANPFTFQGAYGVMQEGAATLYYMRARYFDGVSARFFSRDPVTSIDPRAMSPYQFAFANPMQRADPAGTDSTGPQVVDPSGGCFIWVDSLTGERAADSLSGILEYASRNSIGGMGYDSSQPGSVFGHGRSFARVPVPCPPPAPATAGVGGVIVSKSGQPVTTGAGGVAGLATADGRLAFGWARSDAAKNAHLDTVRALIALQAPEGSPSNPYPVPSPAPGPAPNPNPGANPNPSPDPAWAQNEANNAQGTVEVAAGLGAASAVAGYFAYLLLLLL